MADTIQIKGQKPLDIEPIDPSPCSVECPLGTNVKAYVSLIAAGRFLDALEDVRQTNPFPGICGRVCPHTCEDQCRGKEFGGPLSIAALKRFVADYELRRGVMPQYPRVRPKRGKVAVIGSGPAGLTCAADLARGGHRVTVFEALPVAGGMMAVAIPAYRLPRDILAAEIAAIEALGVKIHLNTRVGDRPGFDDLAREFEAVFIATGAQRILRLGLPGEDDVQRGVVSWKRLLRGVALGRGEKPGDRVVVVGGGNTAVDSARVALRLGAKDVQIIYRRSQEHMPAYTEEVADAEEEGVTIHFLVSPIGLLTKEGSLSGIDCVRMRLGRKGGSGRPRPLPIRNTEFTIPCDTVIPAVGQELDSSFLGSKHKLRLSDRNLLVIDPDTMATHQRGVFAGGDVVTGPASVVDAIAAGHRGADSIIRYLQGLPLKRPPVDVHPDLRELFLGTQRPPERPRVEGPRLSRPQRRASFAEVDKGLTEAQAVAEAERCMRCGLCLECPECLGVCDGRQIILETPGLDARHMLRQPGTLIRVPPDIHRKVAGKGPVSATYHARQYQISTFTARVDQHLCRGCGLCEAVCGYRAVRVIYRGNGLFTAEVDDDVCRGCGTCVPACPSGAIDQDHFTAERIDRMVDAELHGGRGAPPVVVFSCRWNGALRYEPPNPPAELIQVMCIGRVVPGDVLKAFEKGAKGVLMVGCADDDCHYGFGSCAACETLQQASDMLSLLGIERDRLGIVQVPAENAPNLLGLVEDFITKIRGSIKPKRRH